MRDWCGELSAGMGVGKDEGQGGRHQAAIDQTLEQYVPVTWDQKGFFTLAVRR